MQTVMRPESMKSSRATKKNSIVRFEDGVDMTLFDRETLKVMGGNDELVYPARAVPQQALQDQDAEDEKQRQFTLPNDSRD